jgi:cytochrome c-type biogenesis protein CcmH
VTLVLSIHLALALSFGQGVSAAAGRDTTLKDEARDSVLEARVRDIASSLRCPVCQNLSIQDSPSELAQDMKRIVREQLAAGKTPEEVRQYFVARYGEWVLLEPPARGANLAVWVLPALVVVGGVALVWVAVQRWMAVGPAHTAVSTDAADLRARRERLVTALAELETDHSDGKVTAADYQALKERDEAELRAVKAALKERREISRAPSPATGRESFREPRAPARMNPAVAWSLAIVAFGAVVAFALTKAVAPRPAGGAITGVDLSGGSTPDGSEESAIAPVDTARQHLLERRVARDSNDYPSLMELGHMYLAEQRLAKSAAVNMRAVRLKPDAPETAEAFAHLGMILWSAGETDAGLRSLAKALELKPDFPEALLYQGIILFAGRRDMTGASAAWERYLEVAPPDANTARVRAMLQAARSAR